MKRIGNPWKLALGALAAVFCGELLTGCATIHQSAETAGSGTNAVRRTEMRIRALGDSKQIVERLRASNGATQSLGASGVEQETTSEVVGAAVGAAINTAVEAAKKAK